MSKPPQTPYPPDLGEEQPHVGELGDLTDVVARDLDWANARAVRLVAERVELVRCRLTGVELAEGTLRDVTFDGCRLDLAGLRHARLERVVFRACRMTECDFYGSMLKDVLFESCELREATFSECTLERVELRDCALDGLRGAEALRGARMPWSDVVGSAVLFATAVGVEIID